MSIAELYKQTVLEHNRAPRNFGALPGHTHAGEGSNPMCGDHLRCELRVVEGRIAEAKFAGEACAIATAGASILSELVLGRDETEVRALRERFAAYLEAAAGEDSVLGELNALSELRRYPARRRCAMLAFEAVVGALGAGAVGDTHHSSIDAGAVVSIRDTHDSKEADQDTHGSRPSIRDTHDPRAAIGDTHHSAIDASIRDTHKSKAVEDTHRPPSGIAAFKDTHQPGATGSTQNTPTNQDTHDPRLPPTAFEDTHHSPTSAASPSHHAPPRPPIRDTSAMAPLTFRLATPADIPALVALVESAYRGDSSRQGWTTEADLLQGQRTDPVSLAAVLAEPDSRVVLAFRGDELLACAHLEKHDGDACYFGMFSVRPNLQGAGIGRLVMHECERQARDEMGCTKMDMTVIVQRHELIAWYERRGFRATGERKPFPYGDERFGLPQRDDLEFIVLAKPL